MVNDASKNCGSRESQSGDGLIVLVGAILDRPSESFTYTSSFQARPTKNDNRIISRGEKREERTYRYGKGQTCFQG